MLRSMTGFGQATGDFEKFMVKAEIKALNGKFLEINLRTPKIILNKEAELRNTFGKMLERGTVTLSVNLEFKNPGDLLQPINKEVVNFYLNEIHLIEHNLDVPKGSLTGSLFNIPNALQSTENELSEAEWKEILSVLMKAYNAFELFRKQEGALTEKEICAMVSRINSLCDEVEILEPERMKGVRDRIQGDLENMLAKDQIDTNRLEQELIYYIEKMDIAEEKLRLKNHCDYFLQTISENSTGKKLGFIAQEMGREINTMGAKANFFPIQKKIVEMKDELEKIKEQLNNVV